MFSGMSSCYFADKRALRHFESLKISASVSLPLCAQHRSRSPSFISSSYEAIGSFTKYSVQPRPTLFFDGDDSVWSQLLTSFISKLTETSAKGNPREETSRLGRSQAAAEVSYDPKALVEACQSAHQALCCRDWCCYTAHALLKSAEEYAKLVWSWP